MENIQPVSSPEQPMMQVPVIPKKSNFLLIGFGAVALLGLGLLGGYFLFGNKTQGTNRNNSVTNQSEQVSPTQEVAIPSATPIADDSLKSYSDTTLAISFKYPASHEVSTKIQDSTALKADSELWVDLPQSDQVLYRLYVYNSALSATQWWSQEGAKKYTQLQIDLENAIQPKPSPFPTPSFSVSNTIFAGQPALIAEGYVNGGQNSGNETITVVSFKQKIYMITQAEENKKLSDQIHASFQFITK